MSGVKVAHDLSRKPRTGDVSVEEEVDFRSLLLSEPVLEGLQTSGFYRPSPIQLKAIPLGRCGLDLIVQAKSGTGKTCVFSVVALEAINVTSSSNSVQALVLAPTREIAVQIWEVINSIGSAIDGLRCYTFIGGMPLEADRKKLRRCHIAVGTPGRVMQLLEEGIMTPDSIRLFILDEADKLLEDSFQEAINWIYSCLPEHKQMLALSATYPEAMAQHLTEYMRSPTFVRLNASDPALLGIRQYYLKVPFHPIPQKVYESKVKETTRLLSSISFNQCLIFSNYHTRAESLSDLLTSQGWSSTHICGQQEQTHRLAAMAKLRSYKCRVFVTTDLTSRGIDAENVNLVLHLDVPHDHETYLHRVGRAGRFGTYGASIVLASEGKELNQLCDIQDRSNTDILALPDPIPGDLAKSSGYVNLDHLVITEELSPFKPVPEEVCVEDRPAVEGRLTRQTTLPAGETTEEEKGAGDGIVIDIGKEDQLAKGERLEIRSKEEKTSQGAIPRRKRIDQNRNPRKSGAGRTRKQEPKAKKDAKFRADETETQEPNSDQELSVGQDCNGLPVDSLYEPKEVRLEFKYDPEPVRKEICIDDLSEILKSIDGDSESEEDEENLNNADASNFDDIVGAMADVLDYVHLEKKKEMCRMTGLEEVTGLLPSEILGTGHHSEDISESIKEKSGQTEEKRKSVEKQNGDEPERLEKREKKKGRLTKEDITLGEEYVAKLAPKDDFSDSTESETDSDSDSDSTPNRETESDFKQERSGQKHMTSRRRLNSYRRRLLKNAMDQSTEGPTYADDEESESPGTCYRNQEWTPVEKPVSGAHDEQEDVGYCPVHSDIVNEKCVEHSATKSQSDSEGSSEDEYEECTDDEDGDEEEDEYIGPEDEENKENAESKYKDKDRSRYFLPPRAMHSPPFDMFPNGEFNPSSQGATCIPIPPMAAIQPPTAGASGMQWGQAANPNEGLYEREWQLYRNYCQHMSLAKHYEREYKNEMQERKMEHIFYKQQAYLQSLVNYKQHGKIFK